MREHGFLLADEFRVPPHRVDVETFLELGQVAPDELGLPGAALVHRREKAELRDIVRTQEIERVQEDRGSGARQLAEAPVREAVQADVQPPHARVAQGNREALQL